VGSPINSYRDLIAWQRAFALGCKVHCLTRKLPKHELFGLTSQLRRAGTSVALNIAEGYGKGTRPDYVRYLRTSRGSLYELDTGLLFALEFEYITQEDYRPVKDLLDEAERVLAGLIRSLDQDGT
jgi:four helix bundle protein